jgi:hypothetical protein
MVLLLRLCLVFMRLFLSNNIIYCAHNNYFFHTLYIQKSAGIQLKIQDHENETLYQQP